MPRHPTAAGLRHVMTILPIMDAYCDVHVDDNLEERAVHARTASLARQRNGHWQGAVELVAGNVISSAPSLGGAEHCPKLPPVLILCVLEAPLAPQDYAPNSVRTAGRKLTTTAAER